MAFASQAELDRDVSELRSGAQKWAATDLGARIDLLRRTHDSVARHAEEWAQAAITAKSIPDGQLEGEEWLSGPWTMLTNLAAMADSLERIRDGRSPLDKVRSITAPGGRVGFRMLPNDLFEWILFNGFSADIWLTPGITEQAARDAAGLSARQPDIASVGLVLGAGNISSIGPLDVLYELIAHNRVSILKLNPTFAGLIEAYRAALAPLIEADVLRIVNGTADTGGYLADHPGIAHVHITGSGFTHDLIVWGSLNDKSGMPKLSKPITSELGGVAPIIVVPGKWSKRDIRFQAEHVATQRLNNAGHNCIAGQVVILSPEWPQREQFLAALRRAYALAPERPIWYPGSANRMAQAAEAYPDALVLADRLLVEITAEDDATALQSTEYFAPVLGVVEVPGVGQDFFDAAVAYANDSLQGTLGANILIDPATERWLGAGFERTLADLRYGSIAVNTWTGVGFATPTMTWGAYPGNTISAVGSGIGIVHNALLLASVEKSIMRGPFRPLPRSLPGANGGGRFTILPTPPWFTSARTGAQVSAGLTRYRAHGGIRTLARTLLAALRA